MAMLASFASLDVKSQGYDDVEPLKRCICSLVQVKSTLTFGRVVKQPNMELLHVCSSHMDLVTKFCLDLKTTLNIIATTKILKQSVL